MLKANSLTFKNCNCYHELIDKKILHYEIAAHYCTRILSYSRNHKNVVSLILQRFNPISKVKNLKSPSYIHRLTMHPLTTLIILLVCKVAARLE